MGLGDSINKFTKSALRSVSGDDNPTEMPIVASLRKIDADRANGLWKITGENWYQIYGYQFYVYDTETEKYFYFTLPIPPQVWQVTPVMPVKNSATMGGVIEQNSAVVFWQINLSGTTGTAVSRREGDEATRQFMAGQFREVMSSTGLLSGIMPGINNAISRVGGGLDSVVGALSGGLSGVLGGVIGAVNNALLPPMNFNSSAVKSSTNGFTEAEELQKFFYVYQQLKATNPNRFNLHFVNFKTNQKWRVSVQNFALQRSAQDPMLTRYSINMQGWDCTQVNIEDDGGRSSPYDRYNGGDLSSVNTMALGSKAVLGALKGVAGRFKIKI